MGALAIPVLGQHHRGTFQPGSMRSVVNMGASGLSLAGAGRLGQAQATDWTARAKAAVTAYDSQLKAASTIADDGGRGAILMWIGRDDVPGSPAERYGAVLRDLAQSASAGDIGRQRIEQLESAVAEMASKVSTALQTYGTLPASSGAGSKPEFLGMSTMCVAGGIALLALVVIPLLLD